MKDSWMSPTVSTMCQTWSSVITQSMRKMGHIRDNFLNIPCDKHSCFGNDHARETQVNIQSYITRNNNEKYRSSICPRDCLVVSHDYTSRLGPGRLTDYIYHVSKASSVITQPVR